MTPDIPELEHHRSVGVGEAIGHGISQKALRDERYHRPFWGVRSSSPPDDAIDLVRQYAPRLRSGQVIAEAAAARLHGLPIPPGTPRGVQLLVPKGAYRPAARGVSARSIAAARLQPVRVDGLPVADPLLTWLTLARVYDVPWLVAVGDALVTSADNYPGLRGSRPACTIEDLARGVAGWGTMAGIGRLRLALPLVRLGVESPWESITRVLLVDGGLPEPEVNEQILHDGAFVARPDLLYRDARVAIQYDGDGHRSDRTQWQADIARDVRLRSIGWEVIHVTQDTLTEPWRLVALVRATLAARS
ncbi:PDDEXK family nuclease [Agrococcus jejuensis]|uniref:Very-short-patch-repair endonuclease n=1 Tax=Agrococcus jejuensis TaxID=399736 RepID=A0A1G8F470_9MICO|nr:hypothetical protein [Agrococcus jejuensis]SDH76943.1 Very-short-patch-repair endonuclease [Agrococcus jejuensis]